MTAPGRPPPPVRPVRILRLLGALAVIIALIAIVTIVKGGPAGRGEALVAVAIILGAIALLGTGLAAWTYIKKETNDPGP